MKTVTMYQIFELRSGTWEKLGIPMETKLECELACLQWKSSSTTKIEPVEVEVA